MLCPCTSASPSPPSNPGRRAYPSTLPQAFRKEPIGFDKSRRGFWLLKSEDGSARLYRDTSHCRGVQYTEHEEARPHAPLLRSLPQLFRRARDGSRRWRYLCAAACR